MTVNFDCYLAYISYMDDEFNQTNITKCKLSN